MASGTRAGAAAATAERIRRRVEGIDWPAASAGLDASGHALTPPLLTPAECRWLAKRFHETEHFRSRVDMARHRFGAGEYRYFAAPLPEPVAVLRSALYPGLAVIANDWRARFGSGARFPATLAPFLARCRRHGQTRPTPLLLRYETGGYNCLHRDLYGEVAFPLQATLLLSEPGRDFEGGEFLLVEQRARQQLRGRSLPLAQGRAVIFPNDARPVPGVRGALRVRHRHGVSEVRRGVRYALGLIFHDAQ